MSTMPVSTTPVIGQRATFYPGGGVPMQSVKVTRVWGDHCVNVENDAGTLFTSVLVYRPAEGSPRPAGYYCSLGDVEHPPAAQEPAAVEVKAAIVGYRQLSQAEQDLMNEGKRLAEQVGEYVTRLSTMNGTSREGGAPALDQRWVSEGRTDLQKGFMSLMRAIARPTTF